MLKCFFFDRDGVLIKDYGYVYKINHLKWLKGARKAIKFLNEKKKLLSSPINQEWLEVIIQKMM